MHPVSGGHVGNRWRLVIPTALADQGSMPLNEVGGLGHNFGLLARELARQL
jgi:hypothetical protein